MNPRQLRIEIGWSSLVVVNAVEPNAEEIHLTLGRKWLAEQIKSECMMQSANDERKRFQLKERWIYTIDTGVTRCCFRNGIDK